MPSSPSPAQPAAGTSGRGFSAKGTRRRQEILDRSIEVFARRGADGTSLRSIAESIGITHAALLHYFDSREQLLVEVFATAEQRMRETVPPPPDATIVGVMTNAARRNRSIPGFVQLYSTLVAAALEAGHPDAQTHFEARFADLRERLARQAAADQAAGRMRSDVDPDAVAALVIAASDGLQTQWLLDERVSVERSLEVLALLLAPPT